MDAASVALALLKKHAKDIFKFGAKGLGKYQSALRRKSQDKFNSEFEAGYKRLGARIDKEGYKPNEFYEMYMLTSEAAAKTARDAKLKILAELLVNVILKPGDPDKLPYSELEHFTRCVDALSEHAIEMLGLIVRVVKDRSPSGTTPSGVTTGKIRVEHFENEIPTGMQMDLAMGLVSQLQSWNLVYTESPPGIRTATLQGAVANQNIFLTQLGGGLFRFITTHHEPETN